MWIFWLFYTGIIFLPKALIPFYFFVLSVFTAPQDTSDMLREVNVMLQEGAGNFALDIVLLLIGALGLLATTGWGNWRLALHRHLSRPSLERLEDDAKRVAQEIAHTISQERDRRDQEMSRAFRSRENWSPALQQDNRCLSKHMMEAHAIIRRLKDAGYWQPEEFHHEIGIAGATGFAAEAICKEIYAAAGKIRVDLKDGFITVVTQPPAQPNTESKRRP